MKKLIAAIVVAFTSLAQADTAGTMANKAGGLFVLTNVLCQDKTGYISYSTANGSRTIFGCWWSDDTMVHIKWDDDDFMSYPLTRWNFNVDVLRRMRAKINSWKSS
jgi:hypothetical protein